MKLFISSDIEGTTGIAAWDETERKEQGYGYFASQMTREVAAACQGAVSAGAQKILIKDAHDSARNLNPSALPRQASVLRGWCGSPYSMMEGLDSDSFDAVIMTGYHSGAASSGNPLSHTMNLKNEWVTLNGQRMSEFMLNAMIAGYLGVPVAMVTGDEALCRFAQQFIPGITTVAVNKGMGGGVLGMHPDQAEEEIRASAQRALLGNYRVCKVPMPKHFEIVVRFRECKVAYSRSFYPGAVLQEEKEVAFSTDDFGALLCFVHFVL